MRGHTLLICGLLTVAGPFWDGLAMAARAQAGAAVQTASDTYDFGSRSVLDLSPVSHTFVLKAGAGMPAVVNRLQPSCHCTRAVVDGETDGDEQFTIPAGRSVSIDVTIDPSDMAPGAVAKEVYIFANGGSTPSLTLHMKGIITPPVAASVAVLDFGVADAGMARTVPLTVTIDPRLLAPGQTAHLVSPDPRLQFTPEAADRRTVGAQAYRVTFPAGMPLGHFDTMLSLALSPREPALQTSWTLPVRGEVSAPVRSAGPDERVSRGALNKPGPVASNRVGQAR